MLRLSVGLTFTNGPLGSVITSKSLPPAKILATASEVSSIAFHRLVSLVVGLMATNERLVPNSCSGSGRTNDAGFNGSIRQSPER